MPKVLFSLGSNMEAEKHVRQATRELQLLAGLANVRSSALYCSAAVGFDGPDFVNSAVSGLWSGTLSALQARLRQIEDAAARDRSAPRFASRTLDIDLVLYGDEIHPQGSGIPRDELLREAFVLRPSAELEPDWVHPQSGHSLAFHWHQWRAQQNDPLTALPGEMPAG